MTKNEKLLKLKAEIKRLMKFESTVKTDDGKELSISDQSVGGDVFVIDENGNNTPAPNGDYTLEDGSTITVTDGKIAEIKPAADDTEMADEPAADAPADAPVDVESNVADNAADVASIISDLVAVVTDQTVELQKVKAELAKVQGKKPAVAAPITQKKTELSKDKKTFDRDAAMDAINKARLGRFSK